MSYDIELVNKVTGETAKMKHPQYVRGGTVPARANPVTKELEQAEQVEAHINITAIITMRRQMAIFGLRMTRSLHTMLTEPRARLKPNMESVDCMVQHPQSQSRC